MRELSVVLCQAPTPAPVAWEARVGAGGDAGDNTRGDVGCDADVDWNGTDGFRGESRERRAVVTATVFVTKRSARLRNPVPPFIEYFDKIMRGATDVGLPKHYVAMLMDLGKGAVPKAERGAEYWDLESGVAGGLSVVLGGRAGEGGLGTGGGGAEKLIGVVAAASAVTIACVALLPR